MLDEIAYALGRNDEVPNIDLAIKICNTNNTLGIAEIVQGLKNKDKRIANDCIKVLYEVGARKPDLISPYVTDFLNLLHSKNNRLVWGGMTALASIADLVPDILYENLGVILSAINNGSVITVDTSMTVLAKLCKANAAYESEIFPLLINHLETCRPKEIAQHAERIAICVTQTNLSDFIHVLDKRYDYLIPSQQARINKLKRKLTKI